MKPSPTNEHLPVAVALATAIASTLCCVLPFVLVSIGITGPWLAGLRIFEPYRIPFDIASIAVLGAAWVVHGIRVRSCTSEEACALPQDARRTRIALWLATALAVLLIAAPYAIAKFGGSLRG